MPAIKLEAQIKSDAGTVAKPAATLRRDADAAFQKNDFRAGMLVLGQLVTVAPDDASSWLRLARTVLQIKPRDDREKALLLDRASTAAYIAYQRAGDRNVGSRQPVGSRPDACRPPAVARQRSIPCACRSNCARPPICAANMKSCAPSMGFGCSILPSTPIRFRRAPVSSSPRSCPAGAPTSRLSSSVAGMDRPAISASEKQLCVEGLKHGERYSVTLRAGPAVGRQGDAGEIG